MGWVIREVSFPWNALDEEGAYRAYATDAKRLTHFSDSLLGVSLTSDWGDVAVSRVCEGSSWEGGYWMYPTEEPERVAKPPTPHTCGKQVRTRSGV
ncbi:MAG: hypothetical protein KTR25_11440 [Myxococcales bacterium]|nr:hypothetical protein [Myxococcales bacterium]